MSAKVELKPCPFCGGKANCYDFAWMVESNKDWTVECTNCGAIIPPYGIKEESIEAWNRRTRHDD